MRPPRPSSLALLLAASLAGPALASPATEATCKRLAGREPPAADRPTPAQSRALKSCDSERLYYGVGRAPDYAAARLCAFAEEDGDNQDVFGGPTILMQLYANGLGGVRRDLDTATAYACALDGAPAETEGRIEHLQAMRRERAPKRFDYCDDITSGLAGGFCSARDAEIAAPGRDGRLRAATARLPGGRAQWPAARKAFDAFVDAHGSGEVDQSGTARASFVIEEEDKTRGRFVSDLEALAAGRWTRFTAADARAADVALNAAYRKTLAHIAGHPDEVGTIKVDEVRQAQRAWLAYRDRFVAYARAARPELAAEAVITRLTRLRTAQLAELAP